MEWTCETGESVAWVWAEPAVDDAGGSLDERYPISIHVDGRRLRGVEAKRWRQRIEAQFPPES